MGVFFVIAGLLGIITSIINPELPVGAGLIQLLFWCGIGLYLISSGNKKETEKAIKDLKRKEIMNSFEETLQKSKSDYEKMSVSELEDYKKRTEKIMY